MKEKLQESNGRTEKTELILNSSSCQKNIDNIKAYTSGKLQTIKEKIDLTEGGIVSKMRQDIQTIDSKIETSTGNKMESVTNEG